MSRQSEWFWVYLPLRVYRKGMWRWVTSYSTTSSFTNSQNEYLLVVRCWLCYGWINQLKDEHSHHCKQPIKLPLINLRWNVCKDFIPILEHPSLVFFKPEKVFLYWPYSDNSDAVFTVIKPELCGSVSKEFQNLMISLGIKVLDTHQHDEGFAFCMT